MLVCVLSLAADSWRITEIANKKRPFAHLQSSRARSSIARQAVPTFVYTNHYLRSNPTLPSPNALEMPYFCGWNHITTYSIRLDNRTGVLLYESCQASSPTPCANTTGASSSPIAIARPSSPPRPASSRHRRQTPPAPLPSSGRALCADERDFGGTAALWDWLRAARLAAHHRRPGPQTKARTFGGRPAFATLKRALAPTSKRQLAAWYRNTILSGCFRCPGRFAQSALLGSPARSGSWPAGADRRRSHARLVENGSWVWKRPVLRHHQLRHVPFLGDHREAGAAGTRQEQRTRSTHVGLALLVSWDFPYSSLLPVYEATERLVTFSGFWTIWSLATECPQENARTSPWFSNRETTRRKNFQELDNSPTILLALWCPPSTKIY